MGELSLVEKFRPHGSRTPEFTFAGMCVPARVVSMYDGDTCKIVIDWRGTFIKITARLDGIDTCEQTSKNVETQRLAFEAKKRLFQLITEEDNISPVRGFSKHIKDYLENHVCMVCVYCKEFDKYGRVLVDMYPLRALYDDTQSNVVTDPLKISKYEDWSFNKTLVRERLAYEYRGGTKLTNKEIIETLKEREV